MTGVEGKVLLCHSITTLLRDWAGCCRILQAWSFPSETKWDSKLGRRSRV